MKGGVSLGVYDEIIVLEETAIKLKGINDTKLYIVSCLRDHERWEDLTIEERARLVNFTHEMWLKQEMCLDIGCICDSVWENRKNILNGKIDKWKFFNILATRWS